MLINSLKDLSDKNNRQIIITTHTPEIVKIVKKENLIFLNKDRSNILKIQQNETLEIKKIVDNLGILPYVSYKEVIFVEGKTDISFLKNLNQFQDCKNIIDITQFSIIELNGCANVDTWIKNDYLENSNIKRLYFRDRNNNKIETENQKNNVIITKKREIENYIPYNLIENYFNIAFTKTEKENWNDIDVTKHIRGKINNKYKNEDIKRILESRDIWNNLKLPDDSMNEIKEWFNKIKNYFDD